jgi:hypothetical protein
MKKQLLTLLLLVCAFPLLAGAQCTYTSVTATITDSNSLPYSNANVSADLTPNPPGSPTCTGGNTFAGHIGPIQTDVNGTFTMLLPANASITPSGTQWKFSVNISPGIVPPAGYGPQAFTYTVTVSGSTQNISSGISAAAPTLSRISGSGSGVTSFSGDGTFITNSASTGAVTTTLGILPVAEGGTATATPGLVPGTGIGITGTWPNQTVTNTGSSAISGQANGVIPLATGAAAIGAQSHMDDGNTTAGTITSSEPLAATSVSTTADGVHPSIVQFVGNTTLPTLTASTVTLLGPPSTTPTAWSMQVPTALPATGNMLACVTTSRNCLLAPATSANVISLWTGTCSSSTFLRGDGSCQSASGSVTWDAIGNPAGNLALTMGGDKSTFTYTSALAAAWTWQNTTAAVSGTNQSSPVVILAGQGFDGATPANAVSSVSEQWQVPNGNNEAPVLLWTPTTSTTNSQIYFDLAAPFRYLEVGGGAGIVMDGDGSITGPTGFTFTVNAATNHNLTISSAGASSGAAGNVTISGGANSGVSTASAGNLVLQAGGESSTGPQGLVQTEGQYVKGTTVTVANIECITAAMTVADCGASPHGVVGVAIGTVSATPISVVQEGQALVNSSASASVGQVLCTGTSAGVGTPSSSSCAAGTSIGTVISITTNGASATLPLVALHISN